MHIVFQRHQISICKMENALNVHKVVWIVLEVLIAQIVKTVTYKIQMEIAINVQ